MRGRRKGKRSRKRNWRNERKEKGRRKRGKWVVANLAAIF